MVTEIITTLLEVITDFVGGVGSGIVTLFNTLFLDSAGKLTSLATWVIVLFGVAVGLGAIAWVSTLIRGKQR